MNTRNRKVNRKVRKKGSSSFDTIYFEGRNSMKAVMKI